MYCIYHDGTCRSKLTLKRNFVHKQAASLSQIGLAYLLLISHNHNKTTVSFVDQAAASLTLVTDTYHISREALYVVDPNRTSGGRYQRVTTSLEYVLLGIDLALAKPTVKIHR